MRVCVLAMAWLAVAAADATAQCRVVDLMPRFWKVVEASRHQTSAEEVKTFWRVMAVSKTDLYGESGLGFSSRESLDAAIETTLAGARQHPEELRAMQHRLESQLPSDLRAFQRTFPDFRCDFPIYVMVSLGQMDGAGRKVNGRPALLLGVDRLAAEHLGAGLRILVDHELFHRYHFAVAGFSDDNAQREVIWRGLWVEGLATYVSQAMNPPASLQDALFLPPDLVERAKPLLPALVAELEPKLNETDPRFFARFFSYHGAGANPPSRVGYYMGALVAEQLAQRSSLYAVAHMQAQQVHAELPAVLATIARESSRR